MTRSPIRLRAIGLVAATLVTAGIGLGWPASAGAAEDREAREREARRACFAGNVERGIEILVDLYGETGHPNYIYNQARCFERNGKNDQAILSYQDYLRKAKGISGAERAEVEKAISDLRASAAVSPGPAAPAASTLPGTSAPPATAALPTPAASGGGGTASPALVAAPPPPPAAESSWRRPAAIGGLAAAGAALGVAIAGHVLRESRAGDFNDGCYVSSGTPLSFAGIADPRCRDLHDGVESAERLMWVGYVGAAVLGGAGIYLLLTSSRPSDGAARLSIRCGPQLGTTGAVCMGRF